MNKDTLDSRRERLVAALYGELDQAGANELNALLAADPALRAELDELEEARGWIRDWEPADTPPSFAVVPERALRPTRRFGWLAWGLGGTAAALTLLVLGGLRVDWIDGGMAIRFGGKAMTAQTTLPLEGSSRSVPLGTAIPASATAEPLTREDLDAYTAEMAQVMAAFLQEAQNRQRVELAGAFGRFYDEVRIERRRDLEALRAEVHGVGLGLLAEQSRTNARLSRILDGGAPDGVPAALTAPNDGNTPLNPDEEKNHE